MARGLRRSAVIWSALGSAGFLLLPWYAAERDLAPAVLQAARFGRPWLILPGLILPGLILLVALAVLVLAPTAFGRPVLILGAAGFLGTLAQGFAIGLSQPGMGAGALVVLAAFLFLCSTGLAAISKSPPPRGSGLHSARTVISSPGRSTLPDLSPFHWRRFATVVW